MRTGSGTQQAQTRRMAGMRFLCYIQGHLETHNFECLPFGNAQLRQAVRA